MYGAQGSPFDSILSLFIVSTAQPFHSISLLFDTTSLFSISLSLLNHHKISYFPLESDVYTFPATTLPIHRPIDLSSSQHTAYTNKTMSTSPPQQGKEPNSSHRRPQKLKINIKAPNPIPAPTFDSVAHIKHRIKARHLDRHEALVLVAHAPPPVLNELLFGLDRDDKRDLRIVMAMEGVRDFDVLMDFGEWARRFGGAEERNEKEDEGNCKQEDRKMLPKSALEGVEEVKEARKGKKKTRSSERRRRTMSVVCVDETEEVRAAMRNKTL
jgi:hypothetical protein